TGSVLDDTCVALNLTAVAQLANGDLGDAEKTLAGTLAARAGRNSDLCTGLLLNNMAAVLAASGRIAEGEKLAMQSIRTLEMMYHQADSVMLRPLQTLASTRLDLGKKGGARAAAKRIQAIGADNVQDRALVHTITGAMFQADGKRPQAEAAYLSALSALKEAGLSESADCGKILCSLAKLYIDQRR